MIDQREIQKIHGEIAANPTELLVDAEMRRVRSSLLSGDGDKEDLITYAKSIVALRFDLASLTSELDRLRGESARFRDALKDSYWEASVYHCPPPRNKRDNPLRHAATIRLSGKFSTESEALSVAERAIASGWASNYIVHKESASPSASLVLLRSNINKIGRALSPPTQADKERE